MPDIPSFSFASKGFKSLAEEVNIKLSIRLYPDGLSFLFSRRENNNLILYYRYSVNNEKTASLADTSSLCKIILEKEDFLKFDIQEFDVIIGSPDFVIIPQEVFMSGNESQYFIGLGVDAASCSFYSALLSDNSSTLVFPVRHELNSLFADSRIKPRYLHSIQVLEKTGRTNEKNYSFIHLAGNEFDFLGFVQGKLRLANIFSFSNHNDFIYFLMLAIKSSGLDPEDDKLFIGGEIEAESVLMQWIRKYVRNYEFFNKPAFLLSESTDEIPDHFLITF